MRQRFSPYTQIIISEAKRVAQEFKNTHVSSAHLFLALLKYANVDANLHALLLGVGIKNEEARLYVEAMLESDADFATEAKPQLDFSTKQAIKIAVQEARRLGSPVVELEHLLSACMSDQKGVALPATLVSLEWDLARMRTKYRELRKNAAVAHQNPLKFLTGNSQKSVDRAYAAMRATWCGRMSTAHLLIGVLQDEYVAELLAKEGIPAQELRLKSRSLVRSDSKLATSDKQFDKGAKRALDRAKEEAIAAGYKFIGPEHILLGLIPRRATLREMLTWGTNVPDLVAQMMRELDKRRLCESLGIPPRGGLRFKGDFENAGSLIFVCVYLAGTGATTLLNRLRNSTLAQDQKGVILALVVLLGSSIGGVWLLYTSPKQHLKTVLWYAFFGLLAATFQFA